MKVLGPVVIRAMMLAKAANAPAITVDHLLAAAKPPPASVGPRTALDAPPGEGLPLSPVPQEDLPLSRGAIQVFSNIGDLDAVSLGDFRRALVAAKSAGVE